MVACLSGRVSFELVQKAVLAGLAGIVAVGGPTSLAVELAEEHGLVLCGFARDGAFNVYSGAALVGDDVLRRPPTRAAIAPLRRARTRRASTHPRQPGRIASARTWKSSPS